MDNVTDWTKLGVKNHPSPQRLLNKWDFTQPVNRRTGEAKGAYEEAFIQRNPGSDTAMTIRLYPSGRLCILGSLHKFWHGANYDNFTYSDLLESIKYLCNEIEISPENCTIIKMEYGVNLHVPFDPGKFLSRVICFKYRLFNVMQVKRGNGKECYLTDYGVKIYDKGKQYKLSYPVLRIEKKITDARYLRKFGITTLADLTPSTLEDLGSDLLVMINLLLMNDKSIRESSLTTQQRLSLSKYRNPEYWQSLSRYAAPKAWQRFDRLKEKHGSESYSNVVKQLTEQMIKKLVGSGNICEEMNSTF